MEKEYVRIQWENRPSIATPLGQSNLNKMDYQIDKNENTLITFDTTKANQSDLLQTIRTLTYDTETGIFVFTFWNGSTYTVDLNIEKIPVTFSMDEYGVITMTTADGTTYTCDIGALIKLYTFVDGDEIDFVTTTDAGGNKTITASIKDGSIVGSKLQPNFLADCQAAKAQAELAATSASSDASDAELSSEDSEAWAIGERNGQPVPSTDPAYENNAKWWAQHGTGSSFAGLTDTNFTNLQNGQIAKYNSTTQKWENTEDEGGLLPHFKITSESGSTVTVVCPDTSVITPTQTSSGIWQCDVPAYGVYTVHAVINGDDAVRTVTVDTVKEYVIHDEHYSYTLNVYAPTGSSIIVTDGDDETYTGTGAGSTAVIFALHQASTLYHITVTYDGLDIDTTITSSATSGGSGSKTITFGTINLTVDEDLIGETIVMAKGTDTVSKVASSTSMVFYPNATGDWRISVDYEGETVYAEPDPIVVSSLSTPVSAELSLVKIPEGATVLPTDDIQIWLACANITDKSYTTLAEVLADRETFETLIADSNACDYMSRSTTWAGSDNLVPTMTSATTPSGEASGINYNNTYPPYLIFDGNDSTFCAINAPSKTGTGMTDRWVQYHFTNAVKVNKFLMKYQDTYGSYHDYITKVKLQGSNNGSTFTDITTETISSTTEEKIFSNNTAYEYYRFLIVDGTVTNYDMISYMILTLELGFVGIVNSQDAMSLIGKYDYCSNALLSNATWASAIASSEYRESVAQPLVPKMTSDTTPSGQVLYSSQYNATDWQAWHVFDRSDDVNHGGWAAAGTDSYGNMYVGYRFTNAVRVSLVSLYTNVTASNLRVVGFRIQAKNTNDSEWTTLLTVTDRNTNAIGYYSFINDNSYTDYKIIIDSAQSGTAVDSARITELQFYGRASSEVLVPLVPKMTSNTTPSGVCFAHAEGNPAYYAFDGNDSTYWSAPDAVDGSIGYEFPNPISVNTVKFRCLYTNRQFTVLYSDDGITYTPCSEPVTAVNAQTDYYATVTETSAHKYWRLNVSHTQGASGFFVQTIQFYQRTVQTNIIHSAVNDTIYMLEDGDPIVLATTNSDGDGILDFSQLPAGPVTLYSSVAKNPDDLTADYSKTITITKTQYGGTTEAYLMPDTIKTLYWYGYKPNAYEMSNGWSPSNYSGWTLPSITENINSLKISGGSSNYSSFGWVKPKIDNPNKACIIIKSATSNNNHWVVENITNGMSLSSADSFTGDITTSGKYETAITGNNKYLCGRTFTGYYIEYSAIWFE